MPLLTFIPGDEVKSSEINNNFKYLESQFADASINIPSKIYATVDGSQSSFKIRKRNILRDLPENINIELETADPFFRYCEEGIVYDPKMYNTLTELNAAYPNGNAKAYILKSDYQLYKWDYTAKEWTARGNYLGSQELTVKTYKDSKLISQIAVELVTSKMRTTPLSILVLGDSTINAGKVTQRLVDVLGTNVNLLGTNGSGENRHQGYSGWKWSDYRLKISAMGNENPFYNPDTKDFDLAYYMDQQGYSSIDVVCIQLGINDIFLSKSYSAATIAIETVKKHADFIINNINEYDSSIKVALHVTIPPTDNIDNFGNAYSVSQSQWRYRLNNFMLVKEMISYFKDKDVDLVPINIVLNTYTDLADGVHPDDAGYTAMGDMVINYLNSLD